ncbi:HEAT repeat domain-containing protein [Archangium lansingense]|uniref:Novel STAND NTPase 3 domain-containing protein n=1 Tax=Archangium lansingense TaxID=2995310 RepID=A0ABT4APN6_9BACT|nr:HEAT repeat domain-containing protein [Archangium lansinium]MCY1083660.1 hypothetical protein [Archangium lansinium]
MASSRKRTQRDSKSPAPSETGATRAYAGYEYQILVSLWVALVLMFEQEGTNHIELEPASQEDIEADLLVKSEEASSPLVVARRLIFQVKLHSTPWTVSEFERVLKGSASSGGSRRSALQRLIDEPQHHYVLITNAQLPRSLQGFRIESPMEQSSNPSLSKKVHLPEGVDRTALARRIGILDQQRDEWVSTQIHKLLSQRLFVPSTAVDACVKQLMEHARDRLLNRAPREWTRAEILRTAESFGGNPLGSSELRAFVPPLNYADIQNRLGKDHAVLLQGPPGAGKTQVLEKLKHEYRILKDPFAVCAPQTPRELREAVHKPGRIFIELEDPWGKFRQEPGGPRWYSELPSLLKLASDDKKIVVTTREAILHESGEDPPGTFQRFAVSLTYEHYDEEARRRILENKLVGARPWQVELVAAFEQRILKELQAPLSLDHFADRMKGLKTDKAFDLDEMLRTCSVGQLAPRFVEEVLSLEWKAVPAAIWLWGLLSLSQRSTVHTDEANEWKEFLKRHEHRPVPWNKLLEWMLAGRWLIREAGHYRVHSTTVEGLQRILRAESDQAEAILKELLPSLAAANRVDDAFRLIRQLPTEVIQLPPKVLAALRGCLLSQLVTGNPEQFEYLFEEARQQLAEADDAVSLLVIGIAGSMDRANGSYLMGSFIPPVWTPTQKAQVQASVEARKVASQYIIWLLPFSSHHKCAGELASWLWSIGWDLTEDFQLAVWTGLEFHGGNGGLGEAIHGVLMTREPAHEKWLDELLRVWDVVEQEDEAVHSSIRHKAQQQMLNELDAEHWREISSETYHMLDALTAAVRERRKQQGYRWLLEHPRREDLLWAWEQALAEQLPPLHFSESDEDQEEDAEQEQTEQALVQLVTEEELRAFYQCCMPDNTWALWNLLERSHVTKLVPDLLDALVTGPPQHMAKCLKTLCKQAVPDNFRQQLAAVMPLASSTRRDAILFLFERQEWDGMLHSEAAWAVYEAISETLSCSNRPALTACLQVEEKGAPSSDALARLGVEDRHILREWSRDLDGRLGRTALVVLAALGEDITEQARVAIHSSDTALRMSAISALGWSRDPDARAYLRKSLEDAHYECRLLAIRGLAPRANETERQAILGLARDGSAPVREACVDAIREGRWTEGLDALCTLLSDSRNRHYGDSDRNVDHHVALAAAKALETFKPLPPKILDSLLEFLGKGLTANVDLRVHRHLIQLLVPMPIPKLAGVLTELLGKLAQSPGEGRAYLRYVGQAPGVDPNTLELRYRALRGLVEHLVHNPEARRKVELAPLLSMSSHPRVGMAATAWLGLGFIGDRAWSACRELLAAGEEHASEKAALLVLASTVAGHPVRKGPIAGLIPEGAPIWKVAKWLAEPGFPPPSAWTARWEQNPDVLSWLKALRDGHPWQKEVGRWLAHWLQAASGVDSLKAGALPRRDP